MAASNVPRCLTLVKTLLDTCLEEFGQLSSRLCRMASSTAATKPPRRPPADKFDERRNQLAESALRTLGEHGYARTSRRQIANTSQFRHGVVDYFVPDKT